MSDLITALQADPGDPDKVHIFVDGKHLMAVTLDVAAAERLAVGQSCPPERIERLHAAQGLQQVFEKALNFISYRPRSCREVEMRLRQKGSSREEVEAVMERLRDRRYLDDREFARFWVQNRMAFSPRGPRLLRSELRQKGVDVAIVDEILAEQAQAQADQAEREAELKAFSKETQYNQEDEPAAGSDLANALELARKRSRSYSNLDEQTAKRRLSAFLMRRGYDYSVARDVLRRLFDAEEDL